MKRSRRPSSLNGPKRIGDGDPLSFETRLVREAKRDAPPAGASGRALLALGLATATGAATVAKTAEAAVVKATTAKATLAAEGAVTGVAGAKAVVALGGAAAPAAATAKGFLGLGITTWLAGGAIAVATTVGVVRMTSPGAAVAPPAPSTVAPVVASAPPTLPSSTTLRGDDRATGPEPVVEVPAVASADVPLRTARSATPLEERRALEDPPAARPTAAAAPPPPSAASQATPVPAPAASTLGREVALVDGARAALANGDPARALSLLDAYDREFPNGTLAPESARVRTKARAAQQVP